MDRVTAEKQTPREERHRYLEQWYPPNGGFRYPGDENAGPKIAETVYIKEEKKDKWTKKYIEIRKDKLLIFKEHFLIFPLASQMSPEVHDNWMTLNS